MKTNKWIFASAIILLTACSSNNEEEPSVFSGSPAENETEVTMTFSPYDVEPMTRTTTSIADVVTHLDVWLVEGDNVIDIHQSSSNDGFGSVNVTLNKTKTYTLYAVGHKAAGAATLADGVISFPDDKVTHSMYYTTTFSPATTTNINALMNRIVAQFQFNTTDAVPAEVTKMQITIASVFDRWNTASGGTHQLDRVSTFQNFSTKQDGTVTFNIYAIVTDAQTLHNITVEAYDSNDQQIQSRTFTDVPLRNGYRTTYTGVYFTDTPTAAAFTVGDWNTYDVVEF